MNSWKKSGIVEESNTVTHGIRLTVATKHLSASDFTEIKLRLKKDHNLEIENRESIFKINPEILTESEINKSYRICADARNLNNITKPEFTCSPSPESVLVDLISLGSEHQSLLDVNDCSIPPDLNKYFLENDVKDNNLYFSSIDIKAAHNSLVLTDNASHILNAILPDYSTVRFLRSPFGLRNVNSCFNRTLSNILKTLIQKRLIVVYADDLLLVCRGRVQHRLLNLLIFQLFTEHGLKLSLNKCSSFVSSYTFLGFEFHKNGIKLTDERVKTILNLPQPKDLKSVQRFLGAFQYISRFIPHLQSHLLPITKLLNKNTPFHWGIEQSTAYDNLKKIVATSLNLNFVDTRYPLILYCDASQYAGGGVLFQELPPNFERRPILFMSRKFSPNQSRLYSSLELELINIIDQLGRLTCYINQSPFPITVVTDAKNVLFLIKSQISGPNPKLCRLAGRLANYDLNFKLEYEKPDKNDKFLLSDFISRAYDPADNAFASIPMASLRKIEKKDICHTLEEGRTYTYGELTDLAKSNPLWFPTFPLPGQDAVHEEFDTSDPDLSPETSPIHPSDINPKTIINLISMTFHDLSPAQIIQSQRNDHDLITIINDLDINYGEEQSNAAGYYTSKSVLHKLKQGVSEICPENGLLVLPTALVANIIGYFHVLHGHLGFERLYKIINSIYFSKNLSKHVKELTQGCHNCQMAKGATNRLPPLSPSRPPLFPMAILSLDYFSVPKSNGYNFILLAVCRFSGFLFLRPCKKEGSSEVIELLKSIFSQVGPAQCVTSDNGSTLLRNKGVQRFLAGWGVQTISLSLAYSPLHNSRAERAVKYFRSLMRSFTGKQENKWSEFLERLLYIYNSTPRIFEIGTKRQIISPFQLFLRRPARPLFTNPSLIKDPTQKEYFMVEKQKIEEMDKFIIKFQSLQNLAYQRLHNSKARKPNFVAGDIVLLKNLTPPKQGELPLKYRSPYKPILFLVHFVNGQLCVLYNPKTGQTSYQHARFIKKYKPRGEIFNDLQADLKLIMGEPFNLSDYKTQKQLLEYMEKLVPPTKETSISNESLPDSLHSDIVEELPVQPVILQSSVRDEFVGSQMSSASSIPPINIDEIPDDSYVENLPTIPKAKSFLSKLRNLPNRLARSFNNK